GRSDDVGMERGPALAGVVVDPVVRGRVRCAGAARGRAVRAADHRRRARGRAGRGRAGRTGAAARRAVPRHDGRRARHRGAGDVHHDYAARPWVADNSFASEPLLFSAYLGAAALALALCALGRDRRAANLLGALALGALLLALGRHTPVHALVRTIVPPLAYM